MPRIGSNASDDPGKKIAAHAAVPLALLFASAPGFAAKPIAADAYLPADQTPQQTCLISFWNVDQDGKETRYGRCSGTVISTHAILTAEHCGTAARVTEKTTIECPNGEKHVLKTQLGHPSTALGFSQDMAVFKIDEPFKITPMKFTQSAEEQKSLLSKPGKCLIAGWGQDTAGKSGTLHAAKVAGLEPDYMDLSCLCIQKNMVRISGSLAQPGDSGGSLVCGNGAGEQVLVGVIGEFHDSKIAKDYSAAELIAPSIDWVRYATGPSDPADNGLFESKTWYRAYCAGASECLESFKQIGNLASSVLKVVSQMRKDLAKHERTRAETDKKASGDPMERDWLAKKYEKLQADMLALYQKCKSKLESFIASR